MKTEIFECGSFGVREEDSKEEKSGRDADSCVKGSRMRKLVPLPEDEEDVEGS